VAHRLEAGEQDAESRGTPGTAIGIGPCLRSGETALVHRGAPVATVVGCVAATRAWALPAAVASHHRRRDQSIPVEGLAPQEPGGFASEPRVVPRGDTAL